MFLGVLNDGKRRRSCLKLRYKDAITGKIKKAGMNQRKKKRVKTGLNGDCSQLTL